MSKLYSKTIPVLSTLVLTLLLAGCGIFGSDDDVSLDGDLSYEVHGSEGQSVFLSSNSYSGTTASYETVGSVTIPESGVASGDLEDGDYDGYQLAASGISGEEPSITLRLLSDGEVLGETSSPTEDGIYMVEVGDIPDFGDFE